LINELVGEELSSVVFVADYVQFDFNGPRLTLFVWPTAQTFGENRTLGDPGGPVRNFVLVARRDLHGFGPWAGEDHA
jgi:hypothetical protein